MRVTEIGEQHGNKEHDLLVPRPVRGPRSHPERWAGNKLKAQDSSRVA